jgi:hypothetical protein
VVFITDGTLDFIDIHKEFSKQGSAIKPLFDTNDVSGVHISSSGEEKLCKIFFKYLMALPGKNGIITDRIVKILVLSIVSFDYNWTLIAKFLISDFNVCFHILQSTV